MNGCFLPYVTGHIIYSRNYRTSVWTMKKRQKSRQIVKDAHLHSSRRERRSFQN